MPTAVESVFDVAFWFTDTAENHSEHMQPQKLHRLLYLSQAYYAIAFGGKKKVQALISRRASDISSATSMVWTLKE